MPRDIFRSGSGCISQRAVAANEDLLAGLTFAKNVLQIRSVVVGGRPNGEADHWLLTADRNPNRRGMEAIAKALGLALVRLEDLTASIQGGKVKALYAIGAA